VETPRRDDTVRCFEPLPQCATTPLATPIGGTATGAFGRRTGLVQRGPLLRRPGGRRPSDADDRQSCSPPRRGDGQSRERGWVDESGWARRAKVIVNATGVWTDNILELDECRENPIIRPTKGVHLLVPRMRLYSQHAVIFSVPRDGRHIFLIPWGDFTLIGTTDTDYRGGLDNPAATLDDVEYLLEAIQHTFPGAQIEHDDIISTFAGLRPLVSAPGSPSALSREHVIVRAQSGLITIAGGKLTTHRLMGEQLTDRVQKTLAEDFGVHARSGCRTKEPLEGAQIERMPASGVDEPVGEHLVDAYGSDATWVLAYAEGNPSLGERIVPELPYLMAEALYAVQHEVALTLCDVLIRRTHVIYETRGGGLEQARAVAELMAPRLGWDGVEIERQVADYAAQVALTQQWREG
jgi:glycerol-3-phosphate dehydrogenase